MGRFKSIAETQREVRAAWPDILQRARTRACKLPKAPELFSESTKTRLGDAYSVSTRVLYLAPDSEAFEDNDERTLCPWATAACSAACLGHSTGMLALSPSRNARAWKTALLLGAPALFRELACVEIEAHARACERESVACAVRFDGSSDTGRGRQLAPLWPDASFYDYTKNERRALQNANGGDPANYRVTYSHAGNIDASRSILQAGGNVAVVFDAAPKRRGRAADPLPSEWLGYPVLDGDTHDARFLDPRGHVVGLRFKQLRSRASALAAAIEGGFVVQC